MPEPSGAMIGHGALFELSDDDGTNWTEVSEVFNITPPSAAVDQVDVTHMQSPNRDREFILGLNDPGEASFEMNFIPGSAADILIQTVKAAYARVKCRITWPNAVVWTFDGLLTGYEPAAPTDDKMTATVTFKVTGSVVADPAAAPVNLLLPSIAGVAQVGQVLTAVAGKWSGAPTFTYQWYTAPNDAIAGATGATYTPVVGDVGEAIIVEVTATNSVGSESEESAATANVIAA